MGLLGGAAYLIKPQTCIPIIAVALYELASAAVTRQRVIATLAKLCAMGVACALVIGPGFALLKADMRIHTNPEASVGVSHFLNMGLNTDTDGAFAVDGLYAACAYDTKQERSRYCLSSAKARLQEMGPAGLAEHLLKKSLVNFADGTFAWCVDFSKREQPVKHETISPLIRSYVYWDGENSVLLRTMAQLFWQMVLLLCPFAVLIGAQGKTRRTLMVLMLSVVGMMAFNMLFEAKARYAYVISPLCVVLAAVGGAGVMRRLGKERAAGIEK